jgi:hypothetical protein
MKDDLELLRLEEIRLRTELCFLLSSQLVTDDAKVEAVRREIEEIVESKRELMRQQSSSV